MMKAQTGRVTQKTWWKSPTIFALAALVAAAWAPWLIFGAPKFAEWENPYKPIVQVGRTYQHEVVPLDGISYQACSFRNITMKYNGTTPLQVSCKDIYLPITLTSDNPAVLGAWALMYGLGMLKPGVQFTFPPGNNVKPPDRFVP